MHLSDARQAYQEFSGKASELSRQLSFAGIAIIWVLRSDNEADFGVPPELLLPAALFSASLASDLLQYIAATIAWGTFHRIQELKVREVAGDPALQAPRWINWPQTTFFALKLIFVTIGYAFVLWFLLVGIGAAEPGVSTVGEVDS